MSKDDFWDRIETVNAGMLHTGDGTRWVPMSHTAERVGSTLWFLTAAGTQIVEAVEAGPIETDYIIADNARGLFAQVRGTLVLSKDRAKLEDLWNPVAASWYDGGIDDPDLRMLSLVIASGEVWVTPTSGLRFMFNIAKAQLTGAEPDMGDHFKL